MDNKERKGSWLPTFQIIKQWNSHYEIFILIKIPSSFIFLKFHGTTVRTVKKDIKRLFFVDNKFYCPYFHKINIWHIYKTELILYPIEFPFHRRKCSIRKRKRKKIFLPAFHSSFDLPLTGQKKRSDDTALHVCTCNQRATVTRPREIRTPRLKSRPRDLLPVTQVPTCPAHVPRVAI